MTSSTPGIFDLGVPEPGSGENPTSLIPPRRLGRILSSVRADAGLTLEDVATLSQGRFSLSVLSSIERGTWVVSDEDARRLCEIYRIESASLVPPRSKLIVDLDEGFLQVDDHRTVLRRNAPSNDEVLARYLTMVYSMRRVDPGTRVPLRVEDLDVLGRALRTDTRRLSADLEALMERPADLVRWRDRLLSRRVLIPAAGVLVAALGIGALVLVQGPDPVSAHTNSNPASEGSASVDVPVDIGTAIVQERNEDGTPGPTRILTGEETVVGGARVVDGTGVVDEPSAGPGDVGLIDARTLER